MAQATARLTRAERKAETRARLLESAVTVLARRGMERASIDELAEHAGYTKGAFYANFSSKEDLFLAMLDVHFADVLGRLDRVLSHDAELEEQAREGAASFMEFIGADPDWERLFFDFSSYATRNEAFRVELAGRRAALRDGIAQLLQRRIEELGIEPPVPVDDIAMMLFSMADGVALQKLLDPGSVSGELYPTMLATFFAGLRASVPAQD
jgi:AcrR family transcriptional regulator